VDRQFHLLIRNRKNSEMIGRSSAVRRSARIYAPQLNDCPRNKAILPPPCPADKVLPTFWTPLAAILKMAVRR